MHLPLFAAVAAILGFSSAATTTVPMLSTPQRCVTITQALSVGSTGADVAALQDFLAVKTTGYFGPITKTALLKWQIANHIVLSAASGGAGQVGPKTRALLKCSQSADATTTQPQTVIPPSIPPRPASKPSEPVPQASPVQNLSGGGGGGAAVSQCAPFTTPQPPASQCTTGAWQLIEDEAGCPAEWDCQDPNATQ